MSKDSLDEKLTNSATFRDDSFYELLAKMRA